MPLETGTTINELVVSNPAHTDGLNETDAHLRLIKALIKNTFPNLTGPMTLTQAQLNALYSTGHVGPDGTAAAPAFAFASEPTLGLYRSGPAALAFTGRLFGNGVVPPGFIMDFGGSVAPAGWLPCDGPLVDITTYPALFAAIGYTWGGSGSQFRVPNLIYRFRRHRDNAAIAGGVGLLQDPMIGSHAHTASASIGEAGAHSHSVNGSTGSMNRNNPHGHNYTSVAPSSGTGSTPNYFYAAQAGAFTTLTDINHEHEIFGTANAVGHHVHGASVTVNASGGVETRPHSATVLTCIKT